MKKIAFLCKKIKPFFFAIHDCTERERNIIQKCLSSQHTDYVAQYLNRNAVDMGHRLYYCRDPYYMPSGHDLDLFRKIKNHKTVIATKESTIDAVESNSYVTFNKPKKSWYPKELSGYFNHHFFVHCPIHHSTKYKPIKNLGFSTILYNVQLTSGHTNSAIRKEQMKECITNLHADIKDNTYLKAIVLRGNWRFEQFSDEYHELFHYLK